MTAVAPPSLSIEGRKKAYTPPPWSSLKNFTLPSANHHHSLLMQLPPELRTMILHYLLKHDTSLSASAKQIKQLSSTQFNGAWPSRLGGGQINQQRVPRIVYMSSEESGKSFRQSTHQLQPSILASCQLLLVEGSEILYSDNTLLLTISIADENNGQRPHISIPCCEDYLIYNASIWDSLPNIRPYVRNFVARFSKLEIELDPYYNGEELEPFSEGWYSIAHIFREIGTSFTSKEIQISCIDKDVLQHQDFKTILELLQYTRFRKISFAFTPQVEVRQHTIDVVTSESPVVDLHHYRHKTFKYEKTYDKLRPRGRIDAELDKYAEQMSDFIVMFEVQKFREAYKGFMERYFYLTKAILAQQEEGFEEDLTDMKD